MTNKKLIAKTIIILYITTTSILFLKQTNIQNDLNSSTFFLQDNQRDTRIAEDILKDTDNKNIAQTRMFHNKVTESIDIASDSMLQTLDPVFLFSLTEQRMHRASDKRTMLLHPLEFILFLIAFIYTVRNWKKIKKTQKKVVIALFVSWLVVGMLSPVSLAVKYLPFLISLRVFIAFSLLHIFVRLKK